MRPLLSSENDAIPVFHFQRKPHPGFNFSIEKIFERLRHQLNTKINFTVFTCNFFNAGYLSKLLNILQAAARQRSDVISHITGEVHFLNLLMRGKKIVITIHDCRFMERKNGLAKQLMGWLYLKAPVQKATAVTVISESTKREVINHTSCSPNKLIVIPNSVNDIFKPFTKLFNQDKPVILQVGAAPNKNLQRLIKALQGIECKLIIIGNVSNEDSFRLKKLAIDHLIKCNLSTEQLYAEYMHCDILSFVSTYEGFGMPIIEANCVERPVITSNISSMPEVAGNAACLVDPFDINSIRQGIIKIIHDADYRDTLVANGRKNKLRFNADVIADQYYRLYKKIADA